LHVPSIVDAPDGERITAALAREPGVYGAIANCGSKSVDVDFEDDEITVDRLLTIIEELGHSPLVAG
jgi:hypothetical protein